MMLGGRLKMIRKEKRLSQADIEERTGLLRCYVSRVENGHTVPSVETLEKIARALEVPLYQLFYEGDQPPPVGNGHVKRGTSETWARYPPATAGSRPCPAAVIGLSGRSSEKGKRTLQKRPRRPTPHRSSQQQRTVTLNAVK